SRFAQVGFEVTGLEVDPDKIAKVNAGKCPIEGEEPGLAKLVADVVHNRKQRATMDYAACGDADVILIAVETPIDSVNQPRCTVLRSALRSLEPHLRQALPVPPEAESNGEGALSPKTLRCTVVTSRKGERRL
ncbi:MAG: hypothetical protein GTO41_17100, partial [Burkholderiales bacterium]|nr:hypothetical protein [Burkholderiales bacterium]